MWHWAPVQCPVPVHWHCSLAGRANIYVEKTFIPLSSEAGPLPLSDILIRLTGKGSQCTLRHGLPESGNWNLTRNFRKAQFTSDSQCKSDLELSLSQAARLQVTQRSCSMQLASYLGCL